MKFVYALLTCAGMTFFCSSARSQSQENSMIPSVDYAFLDKLVDTAKANYPRMKFHQGHIDIAKISLARQKLSWFDALTLSYIYQPNNTLNVVDPSFFNGYQVALFLNIASFLQKPIDIKQRKKELEVSKTELAEYELNLTAEVKKRYYLYIQELTTLKLRRKSTLDAEVMVNQVKYQYEKNERTLQDYSGALLVLAQESQFVIQAEGSLLTAKSSLEELIGMRLEDVK